MVDILKARKNLDDRFLHERSLSHERFNRATLDAQRIIDHIKTIYTPKKIYQWGSLLNPERFNKNSDIDIALEGITDAQTYFRLLDDAMKLTNIALDIVQLEKIEPEFAALIRQSGKMVYERS